MTDAITFHVLAPETAGLLQDADIFDAPVQADQLAAFVSDAGHVMVFASDGGRPVGFASGTVLYQPDKMPTLFVNEVGVNSKWRRRGIATRLCRMLRDLARDKGCDSIWLATEEDNAPARALYRTLGAQETTGIVVCDWEGQEEAV